MSDGKNEKDSEQVSRQDDDKVGIWWWALLIEPMPHIPTPSPADYGKALSNSQQFRHRKMDEKPITDRDNSFTRGD
jgi:hypothetical protein